MLVPSWTGWSTAGATSSWERSVMPWSFKTCPTVSPFAVTCSTRPSTLRVTWLPLVIDAYPTVVPITAARATAPTPTNAALLLLTCASFSRTILQTWCSPGLGPASCRHHPSYGLRNGRGRALESRGDAARRRKSRIAPDPGQRAQDPTKRLRSSRNSSAPVVTRLSLSETRQTPRTHGRHQAPPNALSVLASMASHSVARAAPRVSAIARTVSGTRYDALGRPR